MNFATALLVLVSLCCACDAQSLGFGHCPVPSTQDDFDSEQYLGVWYEVMRLPFVIFELGSRCVRANYTDIGDGVIGVVNSAFSTSRSTYDELDKAYGTAVVVDPNEPAKLAVNFEESPVQSEEANYWVVSTDYETYSIVYSCTNYWFFHTDIMWVLGRTTEFDDVTKEHIIQKINEEGLRANRLRDMDQSCFTDA